MRRPTFGLSCHGLRVLTIVLGTACAVVGCKRGAKRSAATDASAEGGAVEAQSSLPDTVVITLEGGLEPSDVKQLEARDASAAEASTGPKYIELMSGLPRPCEDTRKKLGTVTFNQLGEQVIITSSKTRVRGTCSKKDPHTLLCDWVGADGKPAATQKTVTYGLPKKPITGVYDKTQSFSCKPQ